MNVLRPWITTTAEWTIAWTLLAFTLLALPVALRNRRFLPTLAQLGALAAIDLARLRTLPLAVAAAAATPPLWGWRRVDVALFVVWPLVEVAGAVASLRSWRAAGGVVLAGIAYAGLIAAVRPALPGGLYEVALAAPRWAAVGVLAVAWFGRGRWRLTLPEATAVLLPAGLFAHLFGAWAWPDPWTNWYLATAVSAVFYAGEAVLLLAALVTGHGPGSEARSGRMAQMPGRA